MKRLCLPQAERDKITDGLIKGEIKLGELAGLTSQERNKVLSKYVGEDLSSVVNARFEQALVSKQKDAMRNWIKGVTKPKDPIRREMLKKVDKVSQFLEPDAQYGFLEDLAELKLGLKVTEEEASTLLSLKETVDDLKLRIPQNSPKGSEERLAYGLAVDRFKEYVGRLKLDATRLTAKERLQLRNTWQNVVDFSGFAKSVVASLDNSFMGRQGIKTLLAGDYKIWANTAVSSFKDFGKTLMNSAPEGMFKSRNDATMAMIRADIYSRPNALNGKYRAAKNGYGLGLLTEEAFPTSVPERIPLLGRVFKASETAFNGSAMRMRADLADAIIANAEANGVDMLDEAQASAFGQLVGSMTGRGEIGKAAAVGRELNAVFFSIRFLKSNFDTVTAHQFSKTMTPEAKKMAAQKTLRIAASIGALLTTAEILNPGSVEWDPRSSNFGKIQIGNRRFDITGGMAGLVVLGSRMVSVHNGEVGSWMKSSATGAYIKMSQGEYGEPTYMDTVWNFFEGKLSPSFGMVRDFWKGQNYSGEKPTVVNSVIGLVTPISADILIEELQKGNDDLLMVMLAETLGFSVSDATMTGYGKRWGELKDEIGDAETNRLLKQVTERFNDRAELLQQSNQWDRMTNEQQRDELYKIKRDETERVFRRYGL